MVLAYLVHEVDVDVLVAMFTTVRPFPTDQAI